MMTKQPEPAKLKVRVFSSISDDNYIINITVEQYFDMLSMKEVNSISHINIL